MQIIDARDLATLPPGGWEVLLKRPQIDVASLNEKVSAILQEVKEKGDAAVKEFTKKFDGVSSHRFVVGEDEKANAKQQLSEALQEAIQTAANNITAFHQKQITLPEFIETMPGVRCWRKSVGIEKVGLYIPGGTAPLFSTILMLGIPAKLAGCKQIILCSPPDKDGLLHPAILYAAQIAGVTNVYKIGGAQAIAAMAYGTETVPAVYKIFGPGNQYVTCAKQLIQQEGIAIDMPAGPSEVCVLADETADASFVAADLLAQAEHGVDSQVVLVTTSEELIQKVTVEMGKQLELLERKTIAALALENSRFVLVKNLTDAIDMVNAYAPEHLIVTCRNEDEIAEEIVNAGSVFIGQYSPESAGDYASGTNHTLPTNGFAKMYSGVSIDSFVKKITYQKLSKTGLQNIAATVREMAMAEGLDAHAKAVEVRMKKR